MKRVALAQCTAKKRPEPTVARKLYDQSAYFRKQVQYAETADEWWIQSAKYGLVHPDRVLHPYDEKASDLSDPNRWAWNIACQILQKYDPESTEIVVLGGSDYADPLTPHLEQMGFEVHEPLRGLRIGERMQWLDSKVNEQLEVFA